jgi:GxxExxY protein
MINRFRDPIEPEDPLAKQVIGLAMTVHSALGCGFLESIYVNALIVELREAGLSFEQEKRYSVTYKGFELGHFHADLIINARLIVEFKAVEALAVAHSIQLVNYLAASKIDNGLLLNFGPKRLEFKTKTRLYPQRAQPPVD